MNAADCMPNTRVELNADLKLLYGEPFCSTPILSKGTRGVVHRRVDVASTEELVVVVFRGGLAVWVDVGRLDALEAGK